jgi:hypothetical protein
MLTKRTAMILGALTGLLTLVAMLRLISGAFDGELPRFAWGLALLALVPWIVYTAWRARRARLTARAALIVLVLDLVALALVWLSTVGPVLALACTLTAFVITWAADRPLRAPRGEDRFVRIEELQTEDPD